MPLSLPPSRHPARPTLRPMLVADSGPVRDFLWVQYEAFNAADNTSEGHALFRDFVSARALRDRLAEGSIAFVAERQGAIVGMCEFQRDGYLTLLYVRGDHQGRGLGRRLLACGLAQMQAAVPWIRVVRVRGTPYARGFYAHIGFQPLDGDDAPREDHGIRFHPFKLRLDDARARVSGT
jgi:GNAT superfamily N-acetyltransferase